MLFLMPESGGAQQPCDKGKWPAWAGGGFGGHARALPPLPPVLLPG